MSQLILMRQRIKAIETIKKITHAMRLIAMSTHLRLRAKKTFIEQYTIEIATLFAKINPLVQQWHHPLLYKKQKTTGRILHIVIGSHKGLCGNFNTELFAFFSREIEKLPQRPEVIAIGKKIIEYIKESSSIIKEFNEFNTNNIQTITQTIITYILEEQDTYDSVIVYSNHSKTFFTQKPQKSILLPLAEVATSSDHHDVLSEYHWEQSPEEVMFFLAEQLLHTTLYNLFFQSLIAEQASRFIAMDNSTRNASELLDSMRLNYNKVRQSKITRELTDLAGSFF